MPGRRRGRARNTAPPCYRFGGAACRTMRKPGAFAVARFALWPLHIAPWERTLLETGSCDERSSNNKRQLRVASMTCLWLLIPWRRYRDKHPHRLAGNCAKLRGIKSVHDIPRFGYHDRGKSAADKGLSNHPESSLFISRRVCKGVMLNNVGLNV